ncbi:MAG: hypothetical protein DI535_23770 [Citrobacter freundii]|nr:MAG: hypothetical protein DI535_23770 [Citrobacter freundii]
MNFFSKLLPSHLLRRSSVLAITAVVFYSCSHEKLTVGSSSHSIKTEATTKANVSPEEETAYTLINLVE